jgi:hypothetical protein
MDRRTSSPAFLMLLPSAHRTFGKPLEPKPVKQPKPAQTSQQMVDRPRAAQRRAPSLPTMPWKDDGR